MEQKSKAQVLKGFYSYVKLVSNMDRIYGFKRLETTIDEMDSEMFPAAIKVLKAIDAYDKHGVFSSSVTSIIDTKAKELAEKEMIEARKTSKVEEYMEKRAQEKGESDLEYWTGIVGATYGNVVTSYNLRNDEVLDKIYNTLIGIIKILDWSDISPTDVDTVLKQYSNAYYASSNKVLNVNPNMKTALSEQNFMCNYAGMNTFTSIIITCDLFEAITGTTFKPERIGEPIGSDYVKAIADARRRAKDIVSETWLFYDVVRRYETGTLDIAKMTLEDALSLSYRNTVMLAFATRMDEGNGITSDAVAKANEDLDDFLIEEWRKSVIDKKYKPKYYAVVLELIYNERDIITGRLRADVVLRGDDAPYVRVRSKGTYNYEKVAIRNYYKTHRAISRWIVEQFSLDWDSGVYSSKRNGILLTIVDKSRANSVFKLERPRVKTKEGVV